MQSARIWLDDVLVLSFWGGMPYREWKTKKEVWDGESEYPANTEKLIELMLQELQIQQLDGSK